MFTSRMVLPLVAALVVGTGAGRAQSPAQPPASTVLHARKGPPSRTIYLDVVVTRKPGEAVDGLQAANFRLLDDKKPMKITSFEAVDTAKYPVEAILLIDDVNMSYTLLSEARIQIDQFLRANGGKLALPMTLAVLGDTGGVQIQPGYTHDGNALAASLDKNTISLRDIGRAAGFYGAGERLDDSLKAARLLALYEAQRPGRKIVLWVSPGWPLLSGPEVDLSESQMDWFFNQITWFSVHLRDSQTTLYALDPLGVDESVSEDFYYEEFTDGVKKASGVSPGNLGLQVLAVQTGGEVLNSTSLAQLLQESVGENMAYYRISFEPPPTEHTDVYHSLKVEMSERDLTAHTSTGYYDEP